MNICGRKIKGIDSLILLLMKKYIILFLLFLLFYPLLSQDKDKKDIDWKAKSKDFKLDSIAKDIMYADYNQLKAMAMSLGLKEESTSEAYRKALAEYYGIKLIEKKSKEAVDKIILKRAGELKIYQVKEENEENMHFLGRVKIVIEMKNEENITITRLLEADEIFINTKTKEITGTGNVYFMDDRLEYEGNQFYYNYDVSRGILFEGRTKLLKGGESGLEGAFFKGKKVVQTGKDDIILYDGMLTTCEEDDPHYFMNVSRLWVSEKGEWGVLNGVIYVGKTPVFYFPFYYHPKDILINPAFGFRSREGWYLNTTYFIFGKEEADDEDNGNGVTAKTLVEKIRKEPTIPFSISKTIVNQRLNEYYNKHEFYKLNPEFKVYPKYQSLDIAFRVFTDAYTNLGFYSGMYFYLNVVYPNFPFKISALSDFAFSRKLWKQDDSDLYITYKPEDKEVYGKKSTYYNFGANPLVFRMSQWLKIKGDILKSFVNFTYDFQLEYVTDASYYMDFYKRKLGFTYIDLLADTISYGVKSSSSEITAFKTKDDLDVTSDYDKTHTYFSNNFSLKEYPDIFGLKIIDKFSLNIESIITSKSTEIDSASLKNDGSEDPNKYRYLLYSFMAPNMYSESEGNLEPKEFRIQGTLLDYDVFLQMPEKIKVYNTNKKNFDKSKDEKEKSDKKNEDELYLYIKNINALDVSTDKTELDYMLLLPLFSRKIPTTKAIEESKNYKYINVLFDENNFTYKDLKEEEEKEEELKNKDKKDYSALIDVSSYDKKTYIEIKPIGFNMKYSLVEKVKNEFVFDTTTDNPNLDSMQNLLTNNLNFDEILKMYNINNSMNYTLSGSLNIIKNQYGPIWGTNPQLVISYTKHYSNMDIYWNYLNRGDNTTDDIDSIILDNEAETRRKTEFSIKYSDQLVNDLSFGIYRIKGTGIETDLSADIFTYNELKRYNFMELNFINRNNSNYEVVNEYYYHNRMSYEKIEKLESRFRFGINILPENNPHILSMRLGPTISWIIPDTELSILKDELWEQEGVEDEDILYESSYIDEAKEYIYYRENELNLNNKIYDFFWGKDFWGGARYYRKMFKDITYEIDYSYTNNDIKVAEISNDLIFKLDNMGVFSNKRGELESFTIYPDDIFTLGLFNSIFKYKAEILFKKIENSIAFSTLTDYQKKIDEYKIMTLDNYHTLSCKIPGDLFDVKLPIGDWLYFSTTFNFKWNRTVEWIDDSNYNDFYLDSQTVTLNLLMEIFKLNLKFKKYNFGNSGYGFELDEGSIEIGYVINEIPIFGRYFKLILAPRIGYQFFVKHSDYYEDGTLMQYNIDYYDKNKLVFMFDLDFIIGKGTSFETLFHFGVKSENKKMYLYYQEDGLTDFFQDIVDSFNFGSSEEDQEKRRKSNFNLQEINVKIEHLLCDWKLTFQYIGNPEKVIENGIETNRYEWNNKFEFYVTWAIKQKNQLMGLLNKTKLEHKYEKDQWQQPVISLDPNE